MYCLLFMERKCEIAKKRKSKKLAKDKKVYYKYWNAIEYLRNYMIPEVVLKINQPKILKRPTSKSVASIKKQYTTIRKRLAKMDYELPTVHELSQAYQDETIQDEFVTTFDNELPDTVITNYVQKSTKDNVQESDTVEEELLQLADIYNERINEIKESLNEKYIYSKDTFPYINGGPADPWWLSRYETVMNGIEQIIDKGFGGKFVDAIMDSTVYDALYAVGQSPSDCDESWQEIEEFVGDFLIDMLSSFS